LATRDSVKCRRLIESAWYQEFWGDRYQLTDDQNQKNRFENTKTGYRIVVPMSAGTAVTRSSSCNGFTSPDLTGDLVAKGGYDLVCLPAEFEPGIWRSRIWTGKLADEKARQVAAREALSWSKPVE
jgi:hypothetical protein